MKRTAEMVRLLDECHLIHGLVKVQELVLTSILRDDDPSYLQDDEWRTLPRGCEFLAEEIDRRFRAIAQTGRAPEDDAAELGGGAR